AQQSSSDNKGVLVYVDGQLISDTLTPWGTEFSYWSSSGIALTAGYHSVEFDGSDNGYCWETMLLDNVSFTVTDWLFHGVTVEVSPSSGPAFTTIRSDLSTMNFGSNVEIVVRTFLTPSESAIYGFSTAGTLYISSDADPANATQGTMRELSAG